MASGRPHLDLRGAVPVASPLIRGVRGATLGSNNHLATPSVRSASGVTESLGSVTFALGLV